MSAALLNKQALEMLSSTPANIVDPIFPQSKEFGKRVRFICSPPTSPVLGPKRPRGGAPVVTPDSKPRDCSFDIPALSLDGSGSPRTKRIKFYSSLAAVREESASAMLPPCSSCNSATVVSCRGKAFERSDLDYFEPCEGTVCLDCSAPRCGTCDAPIRALPFCKSCLEMVVYESGSYVANVQPYAKFLCKGGGDDCCCNALICDACHAGTDHVAAVAATHNKLAASSTDDGRDSDDEFKYVLQEPITKDSRLCEDCVARLHDLTK